jgi:type II pantothenate kinase
VDAGATLWKLVRMGPEIEKAVVPAGDVEAASARIRTWQPRCVATTGGGAQRLGAGLESDLPGVSIHHFAEFQAWGRGVPVLAKHEGLGLPESYLVVSLGTGTSVLWVQGERCERVGGSALGGGSLLGLGQLLLETGSFERIAELARGGDRRRVDLLVGDIYPGDETPLPRDLNAASFGKIDSREPADLAHALMGLLGENIALISGELARAREVDAIVYCGSTLSGNPVLSQTLDLVSRTLGRRALFPAAGAFGGAIGAASLATP